MTEASTRDPRPAPSDAILTVPNLLSFFRLGLTPLFLWLALGPERIDLGFGIAVLGLVTDIADGKIARRFGQVSKLGIALDPLSDRLAIAAAAVVFLVHDLAPVWAVAAVLGRDILLVAIGVPLLKARGIPIPPVSKVGKAGSFAVSLTFAAFLASGFEDPREPINAIRTIAFALLVVALPLYYASGLGYVRAGLSGLRSDAGRRSGDG